MVSFDNIEKMLNELEDFIEKSWFYDNEFEDCKLINVDNLLNYIKYLKGE